MFRNMFPRGAAPNPRGPPSRYSLMPMQPSCKASVLVEKPRCPQRSHRREVIQHRSLQVVLTLLANSTIPFFVNAPMNSHPRGNQAPCLWDRLCRAGSSVKWSPGFSRRTAHDIHARSEYRCWRCTISRTESATHALESIHLEARPIEERWNFPVALSPLLLSQILPVWGRTIRP
jgi:hypothetical protein